jgi:hypothetical protein
VTRIVVRYADAGVVGGGGLLRDLVVADGALNPGLANLPVTFDAEGHGGSRGEPGRVRIGVTEIAGRQRRSGAVGVVGHATLKLLPVVVTVGALLFPVGLVLKRDIVHKVLGQGVHGIIFARVAVRTLENVFGILVRFVANRTELVIGHAALGRIHAVTIRAPHFLLLGMPLVSEVQASVPDTH